MTYDGRKPEPPYPTETERAEAENDCNYSEIRKEIEAERDAYLESAEKAQAQPPFEEQQFLIDRLRGDARCLDALLAVLDAHGRKGA